MDNPEDPPPTYEGAIGRLRNPPVSDGECIYWAAYQDEHLIASARLSLADGDNADIARVEVKVHPVYRRRGIGTGLLRAVMPALLETRRGIVVGVAMKPDSAGASWADLLGFQVTHRTVMQVLPIDTVPAKLWDVPVPRGYRLTRWIGATPTELLESYAAARPAVRDAPMGRSSYRETAWTALRIRETERELADRGVENRVVVAIETATGQISGVTGILFYPYRPEFGYQDDTSVVAAHRGHGLGRAMKAAMVRWVVSERPGMERLMTAIAEENTYMSDVNHAIGYYTARTMIWVETTATQLADVLASLPTARSQAD